MASGYDYHEAAKKMAEILENCYNISFEFGEAVFQEVRKYQNELWERKSLQDAVDKSTIEGNVVDLQKFEIAVTVGRITDSVKDLK